MDVLPCNETTGVRVLSVCVCVYRQLFERWGGMGWGVGWDGGGGGGDWRVYRNTNGKMGKDETKTTWEKQE